MSDFTPTPTVPTEPGWAEAIAIAADYGALGMDRRGNAFDWDSFIDRIELASHVDLGGDLDAPLIKAVKVTARRAWNEANA